MNGWDFFTYFSSGLLAVSALWIFALFLRDAKGVLQGNRSDEDNDSGNDSHSDSDDASDKASDKASDNY